jgi:hypothetical protein
VLSTNAAAGADRICRLCKLDLFFRAPSSTLRPTSCHSSHLSAGDIFSQLLIRVKRMPKPDPSNCPPLFFDGPLPCPHHYIFATCFILANVANIPPVVGYRRYPLRRFVSSSAAAPTASPKCQHYQFPLGATGFTSTSTNPKGLAYVPFRTGLPPMTTLMMTLNTNWRIRG